MLPTKERSILIPAIKREGLYSNDPANFLLMANISFISKTIETIVAFQLISYFEVNNMLSAIQSGFRTCHSTETLLIRFLSDIYGAIAISQLTLGLLALFDVVAAFDIVDHDIILIKRLLISFGLSGTSICWVESFTRKRNFSVVYGSTKFPWVPALYGLRLTAFQSSGLGPLLYIIYSSDLASHD